MPRHAFYDRWMLVTLGLLVVFGMYMVGSASTYISMEFGKSSSTFLLKQGLFAMAGVFALWLTATRFPYQRLADGRLLGILLLGCAAALVLVLAMPKAGGAHRWIPAGPFKVQPSEFVKIVAVVFLAHLLARKQERVNDPWSVLVPGTVVIGSLAFLIVIEPDLGTSVMLGSVMCVMFYSAGMRPRYLGGLAGLALAGIAAAVIAKPYRLERLVAFFDREADPLAINFQLNQSLIAIGSGGLTGAGLGQSQQKAFYLPAAHTDFIFSVVGEEFGLLGAALLLAAFGVLFWRGIRAALRAPDRFGYFLALGLTHMIVLQALINILVCVGWLPTKGLALPFISYGGSSMLASMIAMGILLNVSQHSN